MVPVYSSTATNYSRDTQSTAGTYWPTEVYVTALGSADGEEFEFEERPRKNWPPAHVPCLKTCILPPKQAARVSLVSWARGRSSRGLSHRTLRLIGRDLRR